MNKSTLVFISSPSETFTPTNSGALATIMHQCCRVANEEGIEPFVVIRNSDIKPFPWPNTVFVDYPNIPESGPGRWLARLDCIVFGWRRLGQRVFAQRIVEAVQKNNLSQYPLIVLNNPETAILLRRKFPQAYIGHWFHNQHRCKPWARAQLKDSVNLCFGVSGFISRWVEEYYGFKSNSVATLYNAADARYFFPAPEEQRSAPVEAPVINFVGRTLHKKAPDLLLRAALLLAQKKIPFSLQIVGDNHWGRSELDDYQKELRGYAQQLEEHGVEVHFTGHVARADIPEVLRRAHINVVPSRWDEPSALVLYEGMACGLATVASKTGGTPEVVGDAALLFERDNAEELAAHLQTLIENPDLRQEYARRGLERARGFTWEKMWANIQELVKQNDYLNKPGTSQ